MWKDPIVEEVRKVREEHAARFNYDLEAIYRDLKEQESKSKRLFSSYPPRKMGGGNKVEADEVENDPAF